MRYGSESYMFATDPPRTRLRLRSIYEIHGANCIKTRRNSIRQQHNIELWYIIKSMRSEPRIYENNVMCMKN